MDSPPFTLVHILISLAGLLAGLVVLGGWLGGKNLRGLTAVFFATTAATSVTGFAFPFRGFTPALAVGVLSLVLLAVAFTAHRRLPRVGRPRSVYLAAAITALYLNFFVLVAQLFQKTPALRELAPTQTEPPFAIAQLLVLGSFAVLGAAIIRRPPALD